jgi:hypothetical protein
VGAACGEVLRSSGCPEGAAVYLISGAILIPGEDGWSVCQVEEVGGQGAADAEVLHS